MKTLRAKKRNLLKHLLYKIKTDQGLFIKEYPSEQSSKLAVLYFKFIAKNFTRHTNNQEVICILETLNQMGYDVILLDKSCCDIPKRYLKSKVDLYIGIDGCGGGKYFFNHLEKINAKNNILILTVQPPGLLRKRLERRKKDREEKLGLFYNYERIIPKEEELIFYKKINKVNIILCPETEDPEFKAELNSLGSVVKKLNWATWPAVMPIKRREETKNEFICMAGSDLLRKGVDYTIDLFTKLNYKLHLFHENKELVMELLGKYKNPKNIIFHGVVDICGEEFRHIAQKSKYFINLSVSEGCATAQLLCMKTGLVPIIDKDAGILKYNCGLVIDLIGKSKLDNIKMINDFVNNLSFDEYQKQSKEASQFIYENYTIETFRYQFISAINSIS